MRTDTKSLRKLRDLCSLQEVLHGSVESCVLVFFRYEVNYLPIEKTKFTENNQQNENKGHDPTEVPSRNLVPHSGLSSTRSKMREVQVIQLSAKKGVFFISPEDDEDYL